MNLLQHFINFLLNQKKKPSLLTVKNYKADIRQFIVWFEEISKSPFDPSKITLQIFQDYKKIRNLSEKSMERHASSLRKFFNFLKINGIISENLLEKKTASPQALIKEDPWMIKNFKSFLYEYKKSSLTIKNYVNDVKSFYSWLKEVALVKYSWRIEDKNLLNKITLSVIEEYKQRLITAKFSPATINRKLSSLRSYVGWARSQGLIPSLHAIPAPQSEKIDNEISNQAQNDNFTYSSFPPKRLIQKSIKGIDSLFDNLIIIPLVQTTQTIRYLFRKTTGEEIFKKSSPKQSFLTQADEISNVKKEFYAPLNVSTRYLPTHKRIWHFIRYVRPNWYKKYHSYSFTHYFHFAILTILCCVVGFGLYSNFFANTQKDNTVLGAATNLPPRILSFQGKLTDSSETPITKESDILFSLYSSENASPEAALWRENDTIMPDSNGAFSVFLGKKTSIPDLVFSQNPRLFLGISVGNGPELSPRQELATASLADSAQTLQGMEPITNTDKVSNVILALDSSGNLSIAGDRTHTFQAIGGNMVLSGKVLSLTTISGSNSNVEIVPDGMGQIDLSRPIQNSTNNNNLTSAVGSVEFDDTVAILATTSAQSAFYINQNSTGPLISASTNGFAKFTLGNDGTGIFAGDLGINGNTLSSTATTFNFLNSNVTTLNIGGAATTINFGISGGNTTIKSDLTLSSLLSRGGILYTNELGKIYQTSSSSSSDCLTGGSNPSFTPCSKSFNQVNSVGIGTTAPLFRLDVQDLQDATAAAQIYNTSTATTAAGLIVKLGNDSTSISASNHFISFETAGIGIVGSIKGNGTGVQYETNGIADFAEYFKKDQTQTIEYGSAVCLNNNGLAVKCDNENNKIIGIASKYPAFLGGQNLGDGSITVGLTGQVETFVAVSNGEIKAGDMLTASDIPGVAVKTTKAGQIIGKALENLTTIDESKIVGYYDPDSKEYRSKANFPNIPLKPNIVRIAKIPILVSVSWYDPSAYLAQNGELVVKANNSNDYSVSNSNNEDFTNIAGFWKVVAANIKAGLINASDTITNTLIVTSDSIIVNGQSLRDYIVNVVNDSGIGNSRIISPVINATQISTDIISPLSSSSLIVKLATPSGALTIENASGSAVARIDDQGNARFAGDVEARRASFSGQLSALNGQFEDASISGTLRAKNILAESIEGLEAKVSSITTNAFNTNFADLASFSVQLSYIPDFAAETAQFNQGLMVFGPTSLSDLSIAGRLSVGATMFITENSLETLGVDLSLQSLRQGGLSIMGGLVYIDTQGNLKTQGDLSVAGKLAVNVISPLPSSDLIVNNASGSSVLSINQAGDVIASGSGTFAKLNFSFIQPVLAVSTTEVIASSSAGVTSIAPYQSEVTINNALVTSKSVIYITPVGTPSAQTPFLIRQIPQKSFTVGVQSPTNHSLDFNWLIVN
jgi:site-specific recombinase XerD